MAKIVMLPQRTPRTAVAWFESVHDVMQLRYLEDDPLEAKTLNKLHSVAAVLCIYADKDLRIQRTSKYFLARRVGLQETDFAAACRDLVKMGMLYLTPHRGRRAGSFELLHRGQQPRYPHTA